MAMIQRCSAAARRVASAVEQRMAFSSLASSMVAPPGDAIVCGRGDKKTKKGKRFKGSFGNCRPKKDKKIERIKDKIEVPRVEGVWIMQYRLLSNLLVVGFVVVSDMLSFLFLLCGARSFVIEDFSLS